MGEIFDKDTFGEFRGVDGLNIHPSVLILERSSVSIYTLGRQFTQNEVGNLKQGKIDIFKTYITQKR